MHYFLQSDLDEFRDVRYLSESSQVFARKVYDRLKHRIGEATNRAEYWLQQTYDFTLDEDVLREYDTFAADKVALDERWRKRIKLELLTEKLNGDRPTSAGPKLIVRYRTIHGRTLSMGDEELYSRFINLLLQKIDPHALWYGSDEMSEFNTCHVIPVSIGLRAHQVKGEWQILGVYDGFFPNAVPDAAERIKGMQLRSGWKTPRSSLPEIRTTRSGDILPDCAPVTNNWATPNRLSLNCETPRHFGD